MIKPNGKITSNRYFLETDPKIVGENALAIRKYTTQVESGIANIKFEKGILDKVAKTETDKIDFILRLVNKLEDGIEVSVRNKNI